MNAIVQNNCNQLFLVGVEHFIEGAFQNMDENREVIRQVAIVANLRFSQKASIIEGASVNKYIKIKQKTELTFEDPLPYESVKASTLNVFKNLLTADRYESLQPLGSIKGVISLVIESQTYIKFVSRDLELTF